MQETLQKFIREKTSLPYSTFTVTKLAGQASYREYFRLNFEDGQTAILMKMPAGKKEVSEEVTKSSVHIDELPFINIQKYLKSLELPVPEIFGYSEEEGFLLLQDIGDKSLEATLHNANEEMTLFFYKKAIDLLLSVQEKTKSPSPLVGEGRGEGPRCLAFTRKFDESLLNWEFDHFLEYGIEGRLQIKVDAGDKKIFEKITRDISQKIAAMPQGFTHRDFQSRNLHLFEYDFWMIDFQDALIGPNVYDLVALLRDSYIQLSPGVIEKLQRYFVEKSDASHPYHGKLETLKKDFNLQTIQRKLKDAGRFQFINTVKKNPSFLKHTPASLGYVKQALTDEPQYQELNVLIKKYLPEFTS